MCLTILLTVYSLLVEFCSSLRCHWGDDGNSFDTRKCGAALELFVSQPMEIMLETPISSVVTVYSWALMMQKGADAYI